MLSWVSRRERGDTYVVDDGLLQKELDVLVEELSLCDDRAST